MDTIVENNTRKFYASIGKIILGVRSEISSLSKGFFIGDFGER